MILLFLLLAAGSVQPQDVPKASAGVAVVYGEKPIPGIVSISSLPETVTLGETVDVEMVAENTGGLADLGTITLSFPRFTDPADGQFVSKQPGTSEESPGFGITPKGQTIQHRDGTTTAARYLRAVVEDDQWEGNEVNTLVVRVQPRETGTFVVQFRVTMQDEADVFNAPSAGQIDQQGWEVETRTLLVVAAPDIAVSPPSHDFGTVSVGDSDSRLFSVENTGGGTLTGDVSVIAGGDVFEITSGAGGFSLTSGQTKTVAVQFMPTESGSRSGTLRVTHNGPNTVSPIDADLTGAGIVEPKIVVTPGSHEFGSIVVGEDSLLAFVVENSGGETLSGSVSISTGERHYGIVIGGGDYSLAAGESLLVEVRFAPQSAGRQVGTLQIAHNGSSPLSPVNVTLAGTGVRLPEISISTMVLDYGELTVGDDSTNVFSITNGGGGALRGEVSLQSDDGSFSIESGGGTYSLSATQSKSVTVRYSPVELGSHSATIQVTHNGSNADSTQMVSLTGSSVPVPHDAEMIVATSSDTLDFDLFDPDDSRLKVLVINRGPDDLNGSVSLANVTGKHAVTGDAAADSSFSLSSGGGSFSLPSGGGLTISIQFDPTGPGLHQAVIRIAHNATNLESPTDIYVRGTGLSPVAAEEATALGSFALLPSFPNPASGQTQISFVLDGPGHTRLILYDMLGREVSRIIDKRLNAGQSTIKMPTTNLPSGRYVLRLQAKERSASRIMVVR